MYTNCVGRVQAQSVASGQARALSALTWVPAWNANAKMAKILATVDIAVCEVNGQTAGANDMPLYAKQTGTTLCPVSCSIYMPTTGNVTVTLWS